MKINAPAQVKGPSGVKRRAKSRGVSAPFSLSAGGGLAAPAAIAGAGPLAAIDSLLALQEVDDRNGSRRQVLRRGNELLDQLDEIRHALLVGHISRRRLETIAQMVRNRGADTDEPRLKAILDDIELRVEVELAKLTY